MGRKCRGSFGKRMACKNETFKKIRERKRGFKIRTRALKRRSGDRRNNTVGRALV